MKLNKLLFFILMFLGFSKVLAATDCTQVTQIPQVECSALIALYNSTDGPNWKNKTGWNVTNTPCGWYGITCSSGLVVKLDLFSNQLSGLIPAELGKLSNLRWLFLHYNRLSGLIPVELGKLSNLQDLILSSNQLSGSIPAELGKLGNLQKLYLNNNQLSGSIPAELSKLSKLQMFSLYSNQLDGSIPAELGELSNLQWFILYSNQLRGSIPAELGKLSNLRELYLSSNQLDGSIPAELGKLSNLRWLSLDYNRLNGLIPAKLGKLSNLQWLNLSSNRFCGNIPLSLMNLNNLDYLYLYNNGLNVTDLDPQLKAFLNGLSEAVWKPQDPSICPASLVTLAFFKAVPDSKGVLLEWQTLSEHENAGFYILRGEPISSECTSSQSDYYEVIKVGFKSTEDDGFSVAPYSYWDDTVKPKTTYCYLLEDRDFGGNSTFHWDSIVSVTTD